GQGGADLLQLAPYRVRAGGGGVRWLLDNSVVLRSGSVTRHVSYLIDVTDIYASASAPAAHIHYLAYHDPLTGLPNRLLLHDRLALARARAERNQTQMAVLFIDLDQFKPVNDSRGHAVGDRLLEDVARRLQGCVRAEDTVSRLGGDEFVVVLSSIHSRADAGRVAGKISTALARPYRIGQDDLRLSASIGVSLYPFDGMDNEALLARADAAMYQAKHSGGGWRFSSAERPCRQEWASPVAVRSG
nr:GGDEF domain-containing protein [Pseudomonadota bacterium]